jgi:6-phosphofructokinase
MIYFFSLTAPVDFAFRLWEYKKDEKIYISQYHKAILLGGMVSYDLTNKKIRFHSSSDRLLQLLPHLLNRQIDTLIISGGSGSLIYPEMKESKILRQYLLSLGVSSKIFVESLSHLTKFSALGTSQ